MTTIIPHLDFDVATPKLTADFKLVLLGESSVGKSSILQRVQNGTFDDTKSSTIGAAFVSKKVSKDEGSKLVNLQIWDTAGQERFHNLTPLYYRNSNMAFIVFDMTSIDTFKKAEYWINELETYKSDTNSGLILVLVGNKADLVSGACDFEDEIRQFLNLNKNISRYFTVSAKQNTGLVELFGYVVDSVDESLFHEFSAEQNGLVDLNITRTSTGNCQC
ncbi:hypothetical protein OGAPHI_006935 [Ogataea philodendri]|uniref:Uncharacterized protein n=1 Tax=Ogataea philodendri TaxID=1378263 RepID=A0A9P8SZQ7_9ASCO|nr:uncharacterized protein OGAPHI_006935 [Ogataea philodendri]KAH3660349.1 hypothetical protein OGAPHI_006935 [Ogataea philodendri]